MRQPSSFNPEECQFIATQKTLFLPPEKAAAATSVLW
jgi:hypothetical protein